MKTRIGRSLTLAAVVCGALFGASVAASAQEGPDSQWGPTHPQHAQPSYHWGWLNGRDASAGSGWIDDATGQPMSFERGSRMGPRGYHWGWLNGRDATAGGGWINDRTGQPMARGQFAGRGQSTGAWRDRDARDSRDMGPPGYHWGWLNGRDASGGEGWINDATGYPLEQGYGYPREASRGYWDDD